MRKFIIIILFFCVSVCFADWFDDFQGYSLNNSFWSGEYSSGVPWFNVSSPSGKYARMQVWEIDGNTGQKFIVLGWNSITYRRPIGTIGPRDRVELTAQVANYHSTASSGHPSWPLAGHIVLGGVALGIGGDDICYQILNGSVPTAVIDNTTVTRAAPALFKRWYDIKIVYHQVEGQNNDLADIYYKLGTDSNWIEIAAGLATGQDLGDNVFIKIYGGDYLAAFDNIKLEIDYEFAENQQRVTSLLNGWQITDLEVTQARPVPPSHTSPPQIERNWQPVSIASGSWHEQFPDTYPSGKRNVQYWFERDKIYQYVNGWYRYSFDTPVLGANETARLRFLCAAYQAHIFVNGIFIGAHNGSFTPFEFDATAALNPQGQSNELLVWIYNDFGEAPPIHAYGKMFYYSSNVGGIEQPVYLICGYSAKIEKLRIDPDMDACVVNFDGLIDAGNIAYIKAFIADSNGTKIVEPFLVNKSDNQFFGSVSAANLQKWDIQSPVLYNLNLQMFDSAGNLLKVHSEKFGYRQFKVVGNKFYLNQRRVKLYFGNTKTYSPSARYFEPESAENFKQWLFRQKAQGVNAIRYHMAGPDAEFVLNICDEAGIMVMQEFPVFHRVFSGISDSGHLNAYLDSVLVELSDFLYRDYNHPSVVMWSLSNEVWSNTLLELYRRFYETAKQIESGTRPMCPTSGLNSFGVPSVAVAADYFDDHNYDMNSWCDLATLDSINERINQVESIYGAIDRPWVVAEFDDVPTGAVSFNPAAGYVEQYILNKKDIRVNKIGLRAAANGDCYESMLKYHGKRVYEMMRSEPVFQGFHPWYNDRNQLPEWLPRLAADYAVMLAPACHNLHWFEGTITNLLLVIMKDRQEQLNGTVRVSLRNSSGTTVCSVVDSVCLDPLEDKWEGAVVCDFQSAASGSYTLVLEVYDSQNNLLNWNSYESKIYPVLNPIEAQTTVGFVGDSGYADILYDYCPNITWKNVATSSDLNSVKKVVILPDALPATSSWLTHATALRWFKSGGRMLVLEQCFDGEIQFLPGISLSTKKECRDNFTDVLMRYHPAFKNLSAQEFRDWHGLDNYIINAALIPITENAICASSGYTAVFDGSIGSGELIFSQLEAYDRISAEPVAAAYIRNLLSYLIEQPIYASVRAFNADVIEPPVSESWSEDFENYPIGQGNNICAPNWTNIGQPASSAKITATEIDGNASRKLSDVQWTHPWLKRAVPWAQSNGDVMIKAQIAVQTLHSSWPLANHLVFSNIALGVSGKNISYKVLSDSEIGKTITDYDYFTKTDVSIEACKWYDIKTVIHKIDGLQNDTADIYYKESENIFWISLVKDIQLNSDFSGFVYTVQESHLNYIGYIDNIDAALYYEPILGDIDANWAVDVLDYAALAKYWMEPCTPPSWCENSDIDENGVIDLDDLRILSMNWLSGL